jgi:hypothetical protein
MDKLPVSFKLGQLFIVTAFCILIFARLYTICFDINIPEALYISSRMQTLSGANVVPQNEFQKISVTIQSIVAYLITSGLLVISINL